VVDRYGTELQKGDEILFHDIDGQWIEGTYYGDSGEYMVIQFFPIRENYYSVCNPNKVFKPNSEEERIQFLMEL
jgi:hypothetical protein